MPAVSKLRGYPTATLEQEARAIQISIDAVKISGSDQGLKKSNSELQKEKINYQIELARRNYALDWMSMGTALLGLGMLVLNFMSVSSGSQKTSKVRVIEAMPTESYVDEQEFHRRSHDAFGSKEEALFWFESDPLRVCSYCGSHAMKPVRGTNDEIQLTTFYKKVPSSAKDLRIVLGSMWFVKPARELQCENCQHRVER